MSAVQDGKLGKYAIVGTLGRGAMGTVYDGRDPIIDRRVAIKTIPLVNPGEDSEAADELARFRREAQAAGRLQHPHIVGVYDYGETETLAYIVMEFVDGTSLKAILDRGERMAPVEAARVMTQLLAGLQYSHERGVVHRDIKPANVMVTSAGVVKIADFGIARIESSSLTQAGTIMGTPAYMSPEQFMGQTVDARTDIYSSGVLLYQLLTGERPFEGSMTAIMHKALNTVPPRPSEISVTSPSGLDAVVARAMAKRPEDRFATAAAFSEAIAEGMTAPARPPLGPEEDGEATMVAPARRPVEAEATRVGRPVTPPPAAPARSKAPLLAGVALVALLAAGGVGYLVLRPGTMPPKAEVDTTTQATSTGPSTTGSAKPAGPVPVPVQPATTAVHETAHADLPKVQETAPPVSPPKTAAPAADGSAGKQAGPGTPATPPSGTPQDVVTATKIPTSSTSGPGSRPSTGPVTNLAQNGNNGSVPSAVAIPPVVAVPAAPPVAADAAPQQATASTPDALRAAIKQAITPVGCALLSGDVSGGALRLGGVVSSGSAPALHGALAQARDAAPSVPGDVDVATFSGPYCGLLDVLRPIAARFGETPPRLQIGLKSGAGPLRKDDYLIPHIAMPDWPAYLTVDYFQSDGTLAHLYPADAAERGRKHAAESTVDLGDPASGAKGWQVDVPFGTDMMVAIASARPLFATARPDDDTPEKYVAALKAALQSARAHGARVSAAVTVVKTIPK